VVLNGGNQVISLARNVGYVLNANRQSENDTLLDFEPITHPHTKIKMNANIPKAKFGIRHWLWSTNANWNCFIYFNQSQNPKGCKADDCVPHSIDMETTNTVFCSKAIQGRITDKSLPRQFPSRHYCQLK